MTAPRQWKRISDFVSTELDDSIVILSLEAGRYYSFTSTGSVIWELLGEPQSLETLVDALVSRFEVAPQSCSASVTSFLDALTERNLVQLV